MKIIYLVRHSSQYKKVLFQNSMLDERTKNMLIPLSCDGERKAMLMSNKYFLNNINYLCSSEYSRALNTAKYISKNNGLIINILSDFNERNLGDVKNIKEEFWLEQLRDENVKTLNGESQKEVRHRMLFGLYKVLDSIGDNESAVIVSHASAITFLLMNWCDLIDVSLEGKVRHLKYNDKTVINDSFGAPEIFKLVFTVDNQIVDVCRLMEGGE